MSEIRSTKEIFKPVACTTPLNACTFCGWPAELYSRSNADGTFSEKAVMCSNFGDDDPTGNACPLHLPPEDFYHATKREAVEYWNERTARGLEKAKAMLEAKVPPEATGAISAEDLQEAWLKYRDLFGEDPHGTLPQLRALLVGLPKQPVEPLEAHPDTQRLDWMESARLKAVPFSEQSQLDEGMHYLWWQIVDGRKSVSGHPLGSLREAIDAARASSTKDGSHG